MAISSRTVLIVAGDARSADAFHHTLDHEAHRLFEVSCLKDALAIAAREPTGRGGRRHGPAGRHRARAPPRGPPHPARRRCGSSSTSPAGVALALDAMEHGDVYRFLVKPWDGVELRGVIRAAVDRLCRERRTRDCSTACRARSTRPSPPPTPSSTWSATPPAPSSSTTPRSGPRSRSPPADAPDPMDRPRRSSSSAPTRLRPRCSRHCAPAGSIRGPARRTRS